MTRRLPADRNHRPSRSIPRIGDASLAIVVSFLFIASTAEASALILPRNSLQSVPRQPTTAFHPCSFSALSAVTFRYSPAAIDHLAALDDDESAQKLQSPSSYPDEATAKEDGHEGGWSGARRTATAGALGAMVLTMGLVEAITPDSGLSVIGGAVASFAGWKALGGDAVREAEKPKDGGYDAKFVVDKPGRVRCILDRVREQGKAFDVVKSECGEGVRDLSDAVRLIDLVHEEGYLDELREAVEDARAKDRVRRLHPVVMRTLIDRHSYDAGVNGVADWIHSVDSVIGKKSGSQDDGIVFAITRPPSHHACVSRGMGGCLLNGPAVAAFRALESGADRVAILDIDAHHGNGIAHCVQNEPRIRYCSIHEAVPEKNWFKSEKDVEKKERSVDPRGPGREDGGPLGNVRNVPLDRGAQWESADGGYRRALVEEALPFLEKGGVPDVLIVAAGFDALAVDATSSLALEPEDFGKIGRVLKDRYQNRVAMGLEGGYAWRTGELGEAVVCLVKPWV